MEMPDKVLLINHYTKSAIETALPFVVLAPGMPIQENMVHTVKSLI